MHVFSSKIMAAEDDVTLHTEPTGLWVWSVQRKKSAVGRSTRSKWPWMNTVHHTFALNHCCTLKAFPWRVQSEEELVLRFIIMSVDNAGATSLKLQRPTRMLLLGHNSAFNATGWDDCKHWMTDCQLQLDPILPYQKGNCCWSHSGLKPK